MDDKILQLWRYLKIRDDETLIVKSFNRDTNADNYIVARKTADGGLETEILDRMPRIDASRPFRVIKRVSHDGKCEIPSVEQLKKDQEMDY